MSNPGPTHVAAIRPFLCFQAPGLWESLTYRRSAETKANYLWATADADHASADDRHSVSAWAVLIAAIIITENEFCSVSLCGLECVYLRRMMHMMDYKRRTATPISQDNIACIYLLGQGFRHV